MMKIHFLVILTTLVATTYAQQFSSIITFNRASTLERDSITIGYDALATDTLDVLFNETNIYGIPRDTGLDVRIGNIWGRQNQQVDINQTSFQTRKQIVPDRCGTNTPSVIELDIVSNKWPVYVWWKKQEFKDSCRNGTALTNMNPFQWWTGQGFQEILSIWDYHPIYPNQWFYIDNNDTVYTYWIGLGDSQSVQLFIKDISPDVSSFRIHPNPAVEHFYADIPDGFGRLGSMEIYSADGRLVLQTTSADADVRFLENGVYLVFIYAENKNRLAAKLIKSH